MNLINVGGKPELKEKVLSGEFFLRRDGGGNLGIEASETLYHDPDGKIMVWLNPSQEALAGAASLVDSVEGYIFRIAGSVGELIEKIKIHDAGFDDVVMELCKYAAKLDLQDSMKEDPRIEGIRAAEFRFFRTEGADMEIQFAYPLSGKMEMLAVPLSMYENARAIVARNPVFKERSAGFVKVDALWLAGIIR